MILYSLFSKKRCTICEFFHRTTNLQFYVIIKDFLLYGQEDRRLKSFSSCIKKGLFYYIFLIAKSFYLRKISI